MQLWVATSRAADAKKNNMTSRKIQYWVIPPDNDEEFVANMEDVLETYEKPYAPKVPVICMDEQPVQLVKEVKVPLPATKDHPKRVDCEKIIVVCDNLNTHTKGAFYKAFSPDRARSLARRIEFHYTPKHGSWLNIAENELSSLTRQCVAGRRIGSEEELREETSAWSADVNDLQH